MERCEVHPDKPAETYCRRHGKRICLSCLLKEHSECISDVEEIYNSQEAVQTAARNVVGQFGRTVEDVELLISRRRQTLTSLEEDEKRLLVGIKQIRRKLIEQLNEKATEALDIMTSVIDDQRERVDNDLGELEALNDRMVTMREQVLSLKPQGNTQNTLDIKEVSKITAELCSVQTSLNQMRNAKRNMKLLYYISKEVQYVHSNFQSFGELSIEDVGSSERSNRRPLSRVTSADSLDSVSATAWSKEYGLDTSVFVLEPIEPVRDSQTLYFSVPGDPLPCNTCKAPPPPLPPNRHTYPAVEENEAIPVIAETRKIRSENIQESGYLSSVSALESSRRNEMQPVKTSAVGTTNLANDANSQRETDTEKKKHPPVVYRRATVSSSSKKVATYPDIEPEPRRRSKSDSQSIKRNSQIGDRKETSFEKSEPCTTDECIICNDSTGTLTRNESKIPSIPTPHTFKINRLITDQKAVSEMDLHSASSDNMSLPRPHRFIPNRKSRYSDPELDTLDDKRQLNVFQVTAPEMHSPMFVPELTKDDSTSDKMQFELREKATNDADRQMLDEAKAMERYLSGFNNSDGGTLRLRVSGTLRASTMSHSSGRSSTYSHESAAGGNDIQLNYEAVSYDSLPYHGLGNTPKTKPHHHHHFFGLGSKSHTQLTGICVTDKHCLVVCDRHNDTLIMSNSNGDLVDQYRMKEPFGCRYMRGDVVVVSSKARKSVCLFGVRNGLAKPHEERIFNTNSQDEIFGVGYSNGYIAVCCLNRVMIYTERLNLHKEVRPMTEHKRTMVPLFSGVKYCDIDNSEQQFHLYASDETKEEVVCVDVNTSQVNWVAGVHTPNDVNAYDRQVYVAAKHKISVLNADNGKVIMEIRIGVPRNPIALAIDASTMYVTKRSTNEHETKTIRTVPLASTSLV